MALPRRISWHDTCRVTDCCCPIPSHLKSTAYTCLKKNTHTPCLKKKRVELLLGRKVKLLYPFVDALEGVFQFPNRMGTSQRSKYLLNLAPCSTCRIRYLRLDVRQANEGLSYSLHTNFVVNKHCLSLSPSKF